MSMSELVAVAPRTVSGMPGWDTVRIEERGGAAVITVSGRIDAESASLTRDALAWAISCHERVVVDLSRAEHIDRTGLSTLIAAQDGAHNRAVQLHPPSLERLITDERAHHLRPSRPNRRRNRAGTP